MKKIKKKIEAMMIHRKCVSGVTVIEMVLILVIIYSPSFEERIECIS